MPKLRFKFCCYNYYLFIRSSVLSHGDLEQKEMNNSIGPTVQHAWNNSMHVVQHNFLGFDINTPAFCLGQYCLHLLPLKSSMVEPIKNPVQVVMRGDSCSKSCEFEFQSQIRRLILQIYL